MPRILLIEDDTDINNAVCEYLTRQGCRCRQTFSGTEGLLYWRQEGADLLVVDLMLPGLNGQGLLAEVRRTAAVPVIVLSARTAVQDRVELLRLGADDYLTKPFSLEELWLRIGVQLRHAGAARPAGEDTAPAIRYKDWEIDPEKRSLVAAGQPVELTLHEFEIVALLASRPQKVFTRQEIFEQVWNQTYFVEDKTINVHISNIRAKLRPTGTDGYIRTVWGIGFKCEG